MVTELSYILPLQFLGTLCHLRHLLFRSPLASSLPPSVPFATGKLCPLLKSKPKTPLFSKHQAFIRKENKNPHTRESKKHNDVFVSVYIFIYIIGF